LANSKSQTKRNRQNEKIRVKNRQVRSTIRSAQKNVMKAVEAKDAQAKDLFDKFVKIVDTAAGKGILHKSTASRKKSRLAKKVNALQQQA